MKHGKKVISALLIVCMLGMTVFGNIGQLGNDGTVSAADETTTAALTELTFGDFRMPDINHTSNAQNKTWLQNGEVGTLVNTIFHGKIKFSGTGITSSSPYLIIGNSAWNGIQILPEKNGTSLTVKNMPGKSGSLSFHVKDNGLTSFHNYEFKLSISFEGTETDDVVMKVYFNDVLGKDSAGNEAVYTLSGAKDSLKGYMSIFQGTNTAVQVTSVMPAELTELHFEDFGYADGTYTAEKKATYAGSMKNTVLTGKVTMGTGSYIFYGQNTWSGLQIQKSGDNQIYLNIKSGVRTSVANGSAQVWTQASTTRADLTGEFTLSISAQVFDYDNDGADDAKVGIWADGALIGGQFFILVDGFDGSHIKSELYFIPSGNIKVASTANRLRKLTLNDFGFASGTLEATSLKEFAGTKRPTSLMNTTMTMDVKMTGGGNTWIQYATSNRSTWYAISIQIDSTSVAIKCVDKNNVSIHSDLWSYGSKFGMETFKDTPYQLTLSMEQIDMHGDGANDDVRFGVRFNGRLYCDQFIYLENCSSAVGNGISIFQNRYGDGSTMTTTTLSNPAQSHEEFDVLTLDDFGMSPAICGVGTANNPYHVGVERTNTVDTLDNKIFSTNVRFNSYDSDIYYARRNNNNWDALRIGNVTDNENKGNANARCFRLTNSNGTIARTFDEGIAGTRLSNDTFNLKISIRNVDSDGDGAFDDLELGVWFNDKLYNNAYMYYANMADVYTPYVGTYCNTERGKVVLGDIVQTEATPVTYCADEFAYFVDGDTVTVDGADCGSSKTLSTPGVYDVTYTDLNSTYKETVTVYKTNDITEDGKVDVRDLVAVKKYDAGTRQLGAAGQLAIGTGDAYESVRTKLLSDSNLIGAKEFSEELVGTQTGAGTYVADVDVTNEGTSVMSITETQPDNYMSNADSFDGMGLDYVLDFATDRDIKVLQITDTQLVDSTQDTTNLTAEKIETYKPTDENKAKLLYNELDQLVAETKPDVILLTGDIVWGTYDDAGTLFEDIVAHMDSYKIPWAPIMGNHDQETAKGTAWICDLLRSAQYCMFTRNNKLGGNGNYSIGIAKNGELERTIFMMDSNGIYGASKEEIQSGEANYVYMLHEGQIAWYRTVADRTKVKSFVCMHANSADFMTALQEKGYQSMMDNDYNKAYYDLGMDNTQEDFGFKYEAKTGVMQTREYLYPYFQAAGTDGVFVGHDHSISLSIKWQDIRWTWGLKTGRYASYWEKTGGTLITLDGSDFIVEHKVITDTSVAQ